MSRGHTNLWECVELVRLLDSGAAVTTASVSNRTGYSQRTVQRWLDKIDEDIMPLHFQQEGNRLVWRKRAPGQEEYRDGAPVHSRRRPDPIRTYEDALGRMATIRHQLALRERAGRTQMR